MINKKTIYTIFSYAFGIRPEEFKIVNLFLLYLTGACNLNCVNSLIFNINFYTVIYCAPNFSLLPPKVKIFFIKNPHESCG